MAVPRGKPSRSAAGTTWVPARDRCCRDFGADGSVMLDPSAPLAYATGAAFICGAESKENRLYLRVNLGGGWSHVLLVRIRWFVEVFLSGGRWDGFSIEETEVAERLANPWGNAKAVGHADRGNACGILLMEC